MENIDIDYTMGTASFFVNIETNSDKRSLGGLVKVKCILSPLEYINSDALYRELLGKINPQLASEYVNQLAYAISQLKYRVIQAPEWFYSDNSLIREGSHLDDNVLFYLLDKSVEAEQKFREGIEEKYNKAREDVRKSVDEGEIKKKEEKAEEEMEDDLDE